MSAASPYHLHLAPAVPGDSPVKGATSAAHHQGGQGIFAAVSSEGCLGIFRHRPFGNTFCQFLLGTVEDFRFYNVGQTIGDVVFGKFSVVDHRLFAEQAGAIGLLQKHVPFILFIGEDAPNGGDAPLILSFRAGNPLGF